MVLGKIDHLDLSVDDLEGTLKFFTEKLGFKFVRRTEHGGGAIELTTPAGDVIFEFHQVTEEYKRETALERPYFNHVAFQVDDLDKTYEDLKKKGCLFKDAADFPHLRPETGRRVANTYDADGRRYIQWQDV